MNTTAQKIQYDLFINGKFISSGSGKRFSCVNPSDGEVWGSIADADKNDIQNAICSARLAFDEGTQKPRRFFRKLSSREVEVLKLAARGMTNNEMASALFISLRTVKGHLVEIFSKLGVGSRTEAIITCLRAGIISVDDL